MIAIIKYILHQHPLPIFQVSIFVLSKMSDGYKTPPGSPIKESKPCPGAPGRKSFPSQNLSDAFALIFKEPTTPIKFNKANCPDAPRKRKASPKPIKDNEAKCPNAPRTPVKDKKAICPNAPLKCEIPRTPIESKEAKCPDAPIKDKANAPRTPVKVKKEICPNAPLKK